MDRTKGERGYLAMLKHIMEAGVDRPDRTGTGTREVFGHMLRFDLSDGTVPIFTTKRVGWKTAFKEMLWMLSGSGNIRPLLEQDVHIWSEWPHARYVRETGDAIDLKKFEARILGDDAFAAAWGDTGGAYGVQWRHWPAYREAANHPGLFEPVEGGIDQIRQVSDALRNSPDSRRIIFTGWNPPLLDGMMLPPCHMTYQFQVEEGRLNMSCQIRSWDTFLGAPFNCANAAMLLRMMAAQAGLEPGGMVMFSGCTHVYSNHFDQVREQLTRTPRLAPRLEMATRDDISDYRIGDFVLVGYDPDPAITGKVAV